MSLLFANHEDRFSRAKTQKVLVLLKLATRGVGLEVYNKHFLLTLSLFFLFLLTRVLFGKPLISIFQQIVKTQIKRCIMLHDIRIYTVCKGEIDPQTNYMIVFF